VVGALVALKADRVTEVSARPFYLFLVLALGGLFVSVSLAANYLLGSDYIPCLAAADCDGVVSSRYPLGDPNADLKLVVFSDLICPACKSVVPRLIAEVRRNQPSYLVYRHFPLKSHSDARFAAAVAEVAAEVSCHCLTHGDRPLPLGILATIRQVHGQTHVIFCKGRIPLECGLKRLHDLTAFGRSKSCPTGGIWGEEVLGLPAFEFARWPLKCRLDSPLRRTKSAKGTRFKKSVDTSDLAAKLLKARRSAAVNVPDVTEV